MTTVSCIVITTLVVVSLANLVLLVHVIMHSMYKCNQSTLSKRVPKVTKREDSFLHQDFKVTSSASYNFVAALLVDLDDDFDFVCGVAVVGKKWALTAAHCVEAVMDQPKSRVKISSNTLKLKYGIWYDVEQLIKTNDVALISVKKPFKEKEMKSVYLPTRGYVYLADSTASAVGWIGPEVFAMDLKLLVHKQCQSSHFGKIGNGTFCTERKACVYDNGGLLVQKGVLIGVISVGGGCSSKPVVYTKTSLFEDWLKNQKIGISFKAIT